MTDEFKGNVLLEPDNPFTSVPIEISVCIGKARPVVKDLFLLKESSVLRLDKLIEDPVELYVGESLVALGQLEENDADEAGRLYVRITKIIETNSKS